MRWGRGRICCLSPTHVKILWTLLAHRHIPFGDLDQTAWFISTNTNTSSNSICRSHCIQGTTCSVGLRQFACRHDSMIILQFNMLTFYRVIYSPNFKCCSPHFLDKSLIGWERGRRGRRARNVWCVYEDNQHTHRSCKTQVMKDITWWDLEPFVGGTLWGFSWCLPRTVLSPSLVCLVISSTSLAH